MMDKMVCVYFVFFLSVINGVFFIEYLCFRGLVRICLRSYLKYMRIRDCIKKECDNSCVIFFFCMNSV